jgi:hypothetical protein
LTPHRRGTSRCDTRPDWARYWSACPTSRLVPMRADGQDCRRHRTLTAGSSVVRRGVPVSYRSSENNVPIPTPLAGCTDGKENHARGMPQFARELRPRNTSIQMNTQTRSHRAGNGPTRNQAASRPDRDAERSGPGPPHTGQRPVVPAVFRRGGCSDQPHNAHERTGGSADGKVSALVNRTILGGDDDSAARR